MNETFIINMGGGETVHRVLRVMLCTNIFFHNLGFHFPILYVHELSLSARKRNSSVRVAKKSPPQCIYRSRYLNGINFYGHIPPEILLFLALSFFCITALVTGAERPSSSRSSSITIVSQSEFSET